MPDVDAALDELEAKQAEAEAVLQGNGIAGVRAYLNQKERKEIARLKAFLKQQDDEISGLKERVEALDALAEMAEPKRVRIPKRKSKDRSSAIFLSSDTHWQEIVTLEQTGGVNEHNPEIGHERIRHVHNQMIESLRARSRTHELGHVTYMLGGDDMTNGDMHGGMLQHFVDEMPLGEMEATYQMRHAEFKHLQAKLDWPMRVVAVVSNHGRDTPQMQAGLAARRSYDMAIAARLAKDFPEWDWHLEPTYYAASQVEDFRMVYHHGHAKRSQCRMGGGVRQAPVAFLKSIRETYNANGFAKGHQHTAFSLVSRGFAFLENGSTKGVDGYATDEHFGPPEKPSQTLAFVNHEANCVETVEVLYA